MKRSLMGLIYFIQGMQEIGIQIEQKLEKIGIFIEQLDPQAFIQRELEWQIQNYMIDGLDPFLGLSIGKHYALSSYGPFLMLLLSALNVQQALQQAMQFQQLTYLFGKLDWEIQDNQLKIIYRPVQGFEQNLRTHAEISGTYKFILEIYRLMGLSDYPQQVQLSLLDPKDTYKYRQYVQYYGENISFGQTETAFISDIALLEHKISTTDAVMNRVYKQKCIDELALLKQKDTVEDKLILQIQDYLYLQTGVIPRLIDICTALDISERTLRHQLRLQGISFQQIKEDVLKTRALNLLKQDQYTIEKIALLLGYAEPASFNHAFKRWFGVSPKHYILKKL